MWIVIACIVLIVIFLLVLACLRMSGQSDEEMMNALKLYHRLDNLFACAHIAVQAEVQGLKQLLRNQGCGQAVMDVVDQDAKGIHSMIDSNHQQTVVNKLEADFYLRNEESYQSMLKKLVGCMSDIDGYEEGQKLINDWIQFHDTYISEQVNHES